MTIAAALGAADTAASAGQTTSSTTATVKIFTGCSLQARPLTFDASTSTGSNPIDAMTTITIRCTPNTNFTVDIDKGLYPKGVNRQMRSVLTGSFITYDVYRDSPRSNVWGTGQLKNVSGNSGSGAPLDILIYGRVPKNQTIQSGDYKDTLVVTLNF